jgi:hypothetical protein
VMASDPLCAYEPGPNIEPLVALMRPDVATAAPAATME